MRIPVRNNGGSGEGECVDSAELTGRARQGLDDVAAALNDPQLAIAQVTLEGHTDATGSAEYNLQLSQRRAEAVVAYLVRRGVAGGRLQSAGFGEDRLLPAYSPTVLPNRWSEAADALRRLGLAP